MSSRSTFACLASSLLLAACAHASTWHYSSLSMPGNNPSRATAIAPTADGGFVIGGEEDDPAYAMAWIRKTDSNGAVQWAIAERSLPGEQLHVASIVEDPFNGNVYAAGWRTQGGSVDGWLFVRYPTAAVRDYYFGDAQPNFFTRVYVDEDDTNRCVVLVGATGDPTALKQDAWVVRLNGNSLALDWQMQYQRADGNEIAMGIVERTATFPLTNAEYVLAGTRAVPGRPDAAWASIVWARTGLTYLARDYFDSTDVRAMDVVTVCDGYALAGDNGTATWLARLDFDLVLGWNVTLTHGAPISEGSRVAPSGQGLVVLSHERGEGCFALVDSGGVVPWGRQMDEELTDMTRTPDAGLAFSGIRDDGGPTLGAWMRVDARGEAGACGPIRTAPVTEGTSVRDTPFASTGADPGHPVRGPLWSSNSTFGRGPWTCLVNPERPSWAATSGSVADEALQGLAARADGSVATVSHLPLGTSLDERLVLLDATGTPTMQQDHGPGRAHAISPANGDGFVTCGDDYEEAQVSLIDASLSPTWKTVFQSPRGRLNDVVQLPDGAYLAVGQRDGRPWIVRLKADGTAELQAEWLSAAGQFHAVTWSPDGSALAVGDINLPAPLTSPLVVHLDGRTLSVLTQGCYPMGGEVSRAIVVERYQECGWLLAGQQEGTAPFGWWVRLDADFLRQTSGSVANPFVPSGQIYARGITRTGDRGNAVLFDMCVAPGCGRRGPVLVKYDERGTRQWALEYSEAPGTSVIPMGLELAADGGFLIGATRNVSPPQQRVIRTTPSGAVATACPPAAIDPGIAFWGVSPTSLPAPVVSIPDAYPVNYWRNAAAEPWSRCSP